MKQGSMVILEERQRRAIAEDLHDHLGQALALLRMKLVETQGYAVFCGFDSSFEEMKALLDQIISYTRNLTFEISSPVLAEFGFAAALEWLGEHHARNDGPSIEVSASTGLDAVPWDTAAAAFRCASELAANSLLHSGASVVRIKAGIDSGFLHLSVSDDGCGFDPSTRLKELEKESRFGLLSIIERIRSLGGSVRIDSAAGKGTGVFLTIPLPGEPDV